jgi:hypothetical protein
MRQDSLGLKEQYPSDRTSNINFSRLPMQRLNSPMQRLVPLINGLMGSKLKGWSYYLLGSIKPLFPQASNLARV